MKIMTKTAAGWIALITAVSLSIEAAVARLYPSTVRDGSHDHRGPPRLRRRSLRGFGVRK